MAGAAGETGRSDECRDDDGKSHTGICSCTAESCDGWCQGATCVPFETIATGQPVFPASRGIALVDSDVYWTSSSSMDASADKYRVQRHVAGGSVETLLSGQALGLGPLLVGADRLFVLDTKTLDLQSMKLDGSDLRTDQSTVTSFRYRSGRIYWPQITEGRGWNVSIKSQSVTDPSDVTQQSVAGIGAGTVEVGDVAFIGAAPVCGLNFTSNDAEQTYSIAVSGGGSVFPASTGRLERLEYDGNGNYYWLERTAANSGPNLIMQNEAASSATAITTSVSVTDFTLSQTASGAALVYFAYVDPATESAGIRLYDPSSAETRDVLTGDQVGSLITDATYLYFFESNGHRLVRTPLPHVLFKLGK